MTTSMGNLDHLSHPEETSQSFTLRPKCSNTSQHANAVQKVSLQLRAPFPTHSCATPPVQAAYMHVIQCLLDAYFALHNKQAQVPTFLEHFRAGAHGCTAGAPRCSKLQPGQLVWPPPGSTTEAGCQLETAHRLCPLPALLIMMQAKSAE